MEGIFSLYVIIYLYISCTGSSLLHKLHTRAFSHFREQEKLLSSCGAQASHCSNFFCGARALGTQSQ